MSSSEEFRLVRRALIIPLSITVIFWTIWWFDYSEHLDWYKHGLYPLTLSGLKGIITSPFLHSTTDISHIINNTPAFLFLSWSLFYFYKNIALKIFLQGWIISGFLVWISARPSYHIGISGIIYFLGFFSFWSGMLRGEKKLMAFSLLIVFLYGSMVWGIFPIREKMSWEGHLAGGLTGIALAFYYMKQGPQRKKYLWEIEEELENDLIEEDIEFEEIKKEPPKDDSFQVNYHFKPKDSND